MTQALEPIRSDSLKEVFIKKFERLILSGHFGIGEKLPPERALAKQLGVSRPVVHEGLVNLASKGLISMKPRAGAVINDYRSEGSISLLAALFEHHEGEVSERLLMGLLDMRMLLEAENARLAAMNRGEEHVRRFMAILEREKKIAPGDIPELTEVDFRFHHTLAMATKNMIYPLLMNSFKQLYTNVTGKFFSDPGVVPVVFDFHHRIVDAVVKRDPESAEAIMKRMLVHGEVKLK